MDLLFIIFSFLFIIFLSIVINNKVVWYFKRKEMIKISEAMDYAISSHYHNHKKSATFLNIMCKLVKRVNKVIVSFFLIIAIFIETTIFTLSIIFLLAKDQMNSGVYLIVFTTIQITLMFLVIILDNIANPRGVSYLEEDRINEIYKSLQNQIKSNANQDNIDEDTTNSNSQINN
jgi:hypothetical protein